MNKINILFVEDHLAMIEGYKVILTKFLPEMEFHCFSVSTFDEYELIESNPKISIDLTLLDISLNRDGNKEDAGIEIGRKIRTRFKKAKIIIITSHIEKLVLYNARKAIQPEGFLVKSDFTPMDLASAVKDVLIGKHMYSQTITDSVRDFSGSYEYLDLVNRKIISLLAKGVKTKNIPGYVGLSVSSVDKRKAIIKDMLGIVKGTDEDLIREAKNKGYI